MIHIKTLSLGALSTNAYLIGDTDSQQAVVIDPVDDAQQIYDAAQAEGWQIALILATHAHFDHVLASAPLKAMTNAPFMIHADCEAGLKRVPQVGLMFGMGILPEPATPDRWLTTESETLEVGAIRLKTLYTPGHAVGHLSYFLAEQRIVFSGDALFKGNIGRTDLQGGDYDTLMKSIHRELLPLGDDVRVLSGHGPETTIGRERQFNPYLS